MNANEILFRCSSLGYIMTEPRSKSELLSESCKTHLVDKFVSVKYNRATDIQNKYITKGLAVEEDSITLYSRWSKTFFKKNEENIKNEFISGTPDLFTGVAIYDADLIIDVKSSWDIFTFFRTTQDKLNKMYYWQLQGYMALTGAKTARLVYCLVNTPEPLIYDEKNKLKWKMGVINPDTDDDYNAACDELDRAMRYDDIPMDERVNEITIERNEDDIQKLYDKIPVCRNWMNQYMFKEIPEPV